MALGAGALIGRDLELQERMIGLVRAFGLHKPDETPCGQPVAVAGAHALWSSRAKSRSCRRISRRGSGWRRAR
jgi:hypothetical protein